MKTFIKLILYSIVIFIVATIANVLIVMLLVQIFPGYISHYMGLTILKNIGELLNQSISFPMETMSKIFIFTGIRPYGEIIMGIFCIVYILATYFMFIWKKGKHKSKVIKVFIGIFLVFVSLEAIYCIHDWRKYSNNKAEIIKASQATTKIIYDDIVKIQKNYPELNGFKDKASFLSNGNVYSELKFENNAGPITKENPEGVLNSPRSCFFKVNIKYYPEWSQHKVAPANSRLYHIDYMGNNCIYVETVINVSSDKLSEKLWQVVSTNFDALYKIDQSKTFVSN